MAQGNEDLNKWSSMPCLWIGNSILLRCHLCTYWSIDSRQFYTISQQVFFFSDTDKLIPKSYGNAKDAEAPTTLKKKNKVRGLTLLDFMTYYINLQSRQVWYWDRGQTKRSTEQKRPPWIEPPPPVYRQLIYDKDAKAIQ